eukprot:scaffold86417_cov33-Cyclotella_meneghiniana.AAC.1
MGARTVKSAYKPDMYFINSILLQPTFSVDSESSDGPSSASVSDLGFNVLAQSETSASLFSSIDGQEEVINMDTAESTKSRARDIQSSASGDDSSSSGGGFSLDGQDAVEKPSVNVQCNQEEDPSDDDDDEEDSDDLHDSPHDDEQFTRHETINKALIAQNKFCVDPYCVELKGRIHVYWYDNDKWYEGTVVNIPCPVCNLGHEWQKA